LAAQSIAACAARLGIRTIRTAVSETEVLARLGEAPAELILADTALSRPDTVGFTKRVLARAPQAVLVLLGPEEPAVAAAAVAAGARGLIRGGDQDPVGTVAKALLLIGSPRPMPAGDPVVAGAAGKLAAPDRVAGTAASPAGGQPSGAWPPGGAGPMVPSQRADPAIRGAARRATLTERELQVLQGMAEGKSNAEIGRDLFVSEDTVKTHARRLFRKLRARDRAQAVAVGFRAGALS
jgi:DNA-binding NarL/FixJ family response regulator